MWEPPRLSSCLIRLSVAMRWLLYLRLFYLTAGTLLPFFWMVVILGHRRQRAFERIFFCLFLRQQPAGTERAVVLQQSPARPDAFCLDLALPGALVPASFGAAHARRIRSAARSDSNGERQNLVAGRGVPADPPASAEIDRRVADW